MNQRIAPRVSRSFAVSVMSDRFGQAYAVARNISCGGMMLETTEPLPLGTHVHVQFTVPEAHSQVVVKGEVKHHFFLNFAAHGKPRSMVGMGIRFTEFEKNPALVLSRYETDTMAFN